ncbi:hypothetical protein Tco_1081050 [Tanacetum coccineum]|uniref:Transposase (Putative), gypsy type n=1 Tax=Tanacetum coccineum TaxID=301880 RepID=A0ABQ5HXZ3_9ASTR
MSFSKRSDTSSVCYTKPLDSLKHWNDHFFWVDAFACPVSFSWHTDKNVSKYPLPKSTEFNVDDYSVLVAHPDSFRKFPEPFLCLVGMSRYYTLDEDTYPSFVEMDLSAFIRVVNPTKVKVVEREHAEGGNKLMESTVRRVVPLLPVAPSRSESELEASVDNLFDEGGSANQEDSAAGGGHDTEIELVAGVEDIAAENVIVERHKRQRKKRPAAVGASGSSHPPKKLRGGGHVTPSGVATGGKSPSVLKELLASSILNVEVDVTAVATLPFITSTISATPEREGGDHTDSVTGPNLRTIGPSERFVISSDSSHRSSTNAAEVEVDSFIRSAAPLPVMTEAVITTSIASVPSIPPDVAGSSHRPGKELSMGSWEINSKTLHEIREMDYHHLFTEFNVGTARQACLNAEVRMRTKYCLSERKRLESECTVKVHEYVVLALRLQASRDPTWYNVRWLGICFKENGLKVNEYVVLALGSMPVVIRHGITVRRLGGGRECFVNFVSDRKLDERASDDPLYTTNIQETKSDKIHEFREEINGSCKKEMGGDEARDVEIENLKAQVLLKEAEAAEAARLRIQVSTVEADEKVHVDELNALK